MKFLMLIKHTEEYRQREIPAALIEAMTEFVTAKMKEGIIKDTSGLKTTAEGFRVRSSGGKLKVTDGPFTEAKEMIGGYAMIELPSREAARELATRFMELHVTHWPEFEGECEIRQVDQGP